MLTARLDKTGLRVLCGVCAHELGLILEEGVGIALSGFHRGGLSGIHRGPTELLGLIPPSGTSASGQPVG